MTNNTSDIDINESLTLTNRYLWFPSWMVKNALIAYIITALLLFIFFFNHGMDFYNWVLNTIGVFCFFFFSNKLSINWGKYSVSSFQKNIFWITIIVRFIWILFFSQFTYWLWNTPWEQPKGISMDSCAYYDTAIWFSSLIDQGKYWTEIMKMIKDGGFSDLGYPTWLAILSQVGLDSILWTRIPNCLFDAVVCIMVYRIGKRHFGEQVGRMGAIFTMLMPLTFMYAGITMKESLMIMLFMLAIDQLDGIIHGDKKGFLHIILGLSLVLLLAFFRTALSLVTLAAFFLGLLFTKNKRSKWLNRLFICLFIIIVGILFAREVFYSQFTEIQTTYEMSKGNFENRSRGNILVKNMTKIMFAPLIFTVPFPTMVETGQTWPQLCNGGNFIKNILSFFCIILFIQLLLQRKWRPFTFPIAVLCGYLTALTMSSFAHSGRFHQPAVPLEMMFAAATMYLYPKQIKRLWKPILVLEVITILAWNWFKLAGRGLI